MYLLGLDIGTSSIKATIVESQSQQVIASTQYPESESPISSPKAGWAEQDPEMWWENTKHALKGLMNKGISLADVKSIGISYQMHGLVMIDTNKNVLRPSIIWCDSRAVQIGNEAFEKIGAQTSLSKLLNSPGNFTASKLAWVKANEPQVYEKCHKIMLPGDFISMKLTGEVSTTNTGLSEGIFWDFEKNEISKDILNTFGFDNSILPEVKPVFSIHGTVTASIAKELNLMEGTPVSYKAGDQPNNALSLNVLNPGEIAATAGTSGVIYAVSDQVSFDPKSRINSFAHVNHQDQDLTRIGILMCINGTGILNRWVKENISKNLNYTDLNSAAEDVAIGSNGLQIYPFGNGAERIFENKEIGAQFSNLNFNLHSEKHIFRAAQEGIAFSFKYGFDLMKNNGVVPKIIRAGNANMFLSSLFSNTLVNVTNTPVELIDSDGAKGAALGSGYGIKLYKSLKESMENLSILKTIEPNPNFVKQYQDAYLSWELGLNKML